MLRQTCAVCGILLLACQDKPTGIQKLRFYRMDTSTEISLATRGREGLESVHRAIDSMLTYWEQHYSQTHQNSEVLALNRRDSDTVSVSATMAEMIALGLGYGDTLNGLFDITILPVKELWGFGETRRTPVLPGQTGLARALARVGYGRVHADARRNIVRFDDSAVAIDVGGIAKGFVLREAERLLNRLGHSNLLIVAGGDVLIRGMHPEGRPWSIGIQHPRARGRLLGTVKLTSGSVVTSGDYERFWIKDGVRYHHIFDARTGIPCHTNRSVTIYGPDPIAVDILSTGLFCRPADFILEFVRIRPHLQCVVVDSAGTVHISEGWREEVSLFD